MHDLSPVDRPMKTKRSAYPTLREHLEEAPFALSLSSGFFGFFAHTGVLLALSEAKLFPTRVTGSSAGALVGGFYAAGRSAEELQAILGDLSRSDFWDPAPGAGLLRGKRFRALLDTLLPVRRIEHTRVPFAVSVHDPLRWKTQVLTHGPLSRAIHASCAVPFMFHPVRIEGRFYVDGGVSDRPGLLGMPKEARVLYHHLTSRSPWRRKNSPALEIPQRKGLVTLALLDLPRAHPFALDEGKRALNLAYEKTRRALDRELSENAVRL